MAKKLTPTQKLQERITQLEEINKLLSDKLHELTSEKEEQYLGSATYSQMKQKVEMYQACERLAELHLESKLKSMHRSETSVQQVYTDNKAMVKHFDKEDAEYFVGITNNTKTATDFNRLQQELDNFKGIEEAYKFLLEDRDTVIRELISKISAQTVPEKPDSYAYSRTTLPEVEQEYPSPEDERTIELSYYAYWHLLYDLSEAERLQKLYDEWQERYSKQYQDEKLKYERLKMLSMPDITEEEFIEYSPFGNYYSIDLADAVRKLSMANTKLRRRDDEIKELKKQLRQEQSRRYDAYVPEDSVSYFQLQEKVEELQSQIERLQREVHTNYSNFNTLYNKATESSTTTEQAEIVEQIIDRRNATRKATSKKTGRPSATTPETEQLIMALVGKGRSQREIATELSIGLGTVNRVVKKYNNK